MAAWRHGRLWIGVIVGMLSVTAKAGVTVEIDEPEYWSSTNSRVVGSAVRTGTTAGIIAARIRIGNNVVWEMILPDWPFQIYMEQVDMTVMFDSTHFGNMSQLTAVFEVKTTDNYNWQSASHTCVVKNSVGLYTDPDLSHPGIGILTNAYGSMNYGVTFRDEWTIGFYFVDVRTMNALDLNVHGIRDCHYDGDEGTDTDQGEGRIWPSTYPQEFVTKIGTGLPPFNSTKWPAVNFMHLNACECGQGNWGEVLYPNKNYYSANQTENQAVLAYKCFTLSSEHDDQSEYLMEKLTQGKTVGEAMVFLYTCGEIQVKTTEYGWPRLLELADMVVFGDTSTRLTKVYTGDTSTPSTWYVVGPSIPGGGL